MAVAKTESKTTKVIVNSIDKNPECFVGFNGVGYQIQCGVPIDLPQEVIDILKNTIEERQVAERDDQGRVKGSKMVQEKRFIVEVA